MAINGQTDIGSLASYLIFVRQAALPINQFSQQSNFLLAALAGAERVFEVMLRPPEVDNGKTKLVNVCEKNGNLGVCKEFTGRWAWQDEENNLSLLRGDVRFYNVSFGYDDSNMVLHDISPVSYTHLQI